MIYCPICMKKYTPESTSWFVQKGTTKACHSACMQCHTRIVTGQNPSCPLCRCQVSTNPLSCLVDFTVDEDDEDDEDTVDVVDLTGDE